MVIWGIGFCSSFVIAPGNSLIWIPDALLLVGFVPFLLADRVGGLWLLFGALNAFVGFVLLVVKCMPDSDFKFDSKLLVTKAHLALYHEPFAWMVIGAICFAIGVILLSIFLIRYLLRFLAKKEV